MTTPLRTDAVRHDLVRSVPFAVRDAAGDVGEGDGLTLTGLAAVWDSPTEIDSWEGTFTEQIRKGAFRKTIREMTPVLQFDHGRHPLVGSIPIGRIDDIAETDEGLALTARLSDNWLIEPVRDAIRDRSVTGMSFRFDVVREEWRDNTGALIKPDEIGPLLWNPGDRGPLARTLVELKCRELGPVVFPAYTDTSVDVRARSLADDLTRDTVAARALRRSLAQAVPAGAAAAGLPDDPALRRQVAASLLFGRPGDMARGQHLVIDVTADTDPDAVALQVHDVLTSYRGTTAPPAPGHPAAPATDGAPLDREHPPATGTTDAPPADGHPSPSPRTARMKSQLAEIGELMDGVLASIDSSKEDR
jgi:HK97 family phage prohead protease